MLIAAEEGLVERRQRLGLLVELLELDLRLVVDRALAGSGGDLVAESALAGLRHLIVVAVAFGKLFQLTENLGRDIGLLLGERHRLRVILAEIRLDILQPLGDGEVAGLERDDDRAARLVGAHGRIVEGALGAAVDDRLVLLIARAGACRVGLRDDQLGVEVGELLVAEQLTVAVGGEAVLGPEFLHRHRGRLRAFTQFGQPALQPDGRALGGVETRVELVGQIGFGVGFGDGCGESRVCRLIAQVDNVAAAGAGRLQISLQLEDRVVVARRLDHGLARRGVDILDAGDVIRTGTAEISDYAAQETDALGKGRLGRVHEVVVLVELQLVDYHRRQPRGRQNFDLAEDRGVRLHRHVGRRDVVHDLVQAFIDQHAAERRVLFRRRLQIDHTKEQADDGADRHHLGLPSGHAKQALDVDEVFALFRFGAGQWHPLVEREIGIVHLRSNSRLQALSALVDRRRYQKRPRDIGAKERLA